MPLDNSHNCDYNIIMKRKYRYYAALSICGSISLIIGAVLYCCIRTESNIYCIINQMIQLPDVDVETLRFLSFYLPDYLWAFSFSCFLYLIYGRSEKGSVICSVLVCILGSVFEGAQAKGIISGTGDVVDIFLYIFAVLTAYIIHNLLRRRTK